MPYGPPTSRHIGGRGSSACGGLGFASCALLIGARVGTPTLTTLQSPGAALARDPRVGRAVWMLAAQPGGLGDGVFVGHGLRVRPRTATRQIQ